MKTNREFPGAPKEEANEPKENMKRFRTLAQRLERMSPADQTQIFEWLGQYKIAFRKNPTAILEATEIVMEMLFRKESSEKSREEVTHESQNADPALLAQLERRWEEFRLAAKYEGLEMAQDAATEEEILAQKSLYGKDAGKFESHGWRGRK